MAFFKKNIVLANSKTVGYVTVIRISNSMGIKLTLNEAPTSKIYIGIFSDRDKFFGTAEGIKTEYENLFLDIKSEDNLGVCLFNDRGVMAAYGGKTNIIDKVKIEKYLEEVKEKEKIIFESVKKEEVTDSISIIDETAEKAKTIDVENKNESINYLDKDEVSEEKEKITISKDNIEIISLDNHITDEMLENSCDEDYCDMAKLKEALSEVNIDSNGYGEVDFMDTNQETTLNDNVKIEEPKKETLHKIDKKEEFVNKEKMKKESIDYMGSKSSDETVEDLLNKGKSKNYYYSIKEKLEELMVIHPPEEILEEIVPDSKWVMVHYTKTDYYVVGVLKSNNSVTHIAYGLRGMENVPPPSEAKDFCDFISTEKKNGKNYGYYLFFQNAENGEIVKGL